MKPFPHHYDVHLIGGPSGYAHVATAGVPTLQIAPPTEFDGPGDAWSPEHLLLASVQTCFLFTLRAVARLSHVPFTGLDLQAAGTVTRQDGVTRFTEIVLRARMTLSAGTSRERAIQALVKTEKSCLVSASLSTPIRLEFDIVEDGQAAA